MFGGIRLFDRQTRATLGFLSANKHLLAYETVSALRSQQMNLNRILHGFVRNEYLARGLFLRLEVGSFGESKLLCGLKGSSREKTCLLRVQPQSAFHDINQNRTIYIN